MNNKIPYEGHPPPHPHHQKTTTLRCRYGLSKRASLRAWSSVVIFFLLLVLLLSHAGCDVTFQIHISELQPVSTFNLTQSTCFRQEIYYTQFPFISPLLLLKALVIIKKRTIIYLKLTQLCGSRPSYELYFILNQLLTQDEILKFKKYWLEFNQVSI